MKKNLFAVLIIFFSLLFSVTASAGQWMQQDNQLYCAGWENGE